MENRSHTELKGFFKCLGKSKALKIRDRTDVTKNRSKNGTQNTKKGEFSHSQRTLSNSFSDTAPGRSQPHGLLTGTGLEKQAWRKLTLAQIRDFLSL